MKYSLILGLVFFISYNIAIKVMRPESKISQSQWQENIIKSQRLIYDSHDYDTMIVGSSLSNRFDDFLPSNYYSLSFSGGSIYTGLEILKRLDIRPKLIMIEMNVYTRGIDHGFVEGLFAPGLKESRTFFPALKEEYQPMNLIYPVSSRLFIPPLVFINNKIIAINNKYHLIEKREKKEINVNEIEAIKVINENTIQNNLFLLKEYIAYLQEQEIKFCFFRVPISCQSEVAFFNDEERFKLFFPPSRYAYLPYEKCSEYQTTDGNHLEDKSAKKYATVFISNIRSGLSGPK